MAFLCNFSSVTTPPRGISSRDSSNCGLIRISKCAFQFDAASADELLRPVCQFDLRVSGDGGAGFVGPFAIYLDFAGEDHGKSFLQRLGNPALDEEKIQPLANCFGFHGAFETSGAAENQEFRNFSKPR